jgi:hypothetical protein
MKIEENRTNQVFFEELTEGDVFMDYEEGECQYYIKIETSDNEDPNAVNLRTGETEYFLENVLVFEIEAKLVVG